MVSLNGIEPRRLALRYEPPGIIVEYIYRSTSTQQLYHHEIDLKAALSSTGTTKLNDEHIDKIVGAIVEQHADVLGDRSVPSSQLVRLVRKLVDHRTATDTPPSFALPQADYNRVSETQLKQVKQKMDTVFEQNIIRPDQVGYQYDKQVEFQAATETSDWDD